MENFNPVPRPTPPQPKSLNIEPPTHVVPDVTLMFDSDDSLIWKPGENPKEFLQKINNQQQSENRFHNITKWKASGGLGIKEAIFPNLQQECQNGTVGQSQTSNNFNYGPTITSTPAISNVLPISKSSRGGYTSQIPQSGDIFKQPQVKSVSFEEMLPPSKSEKDFYSANTTCRKEVGNSSASHESHILRLVEGQNQQILYLHNVLEKVLEKLTITDSQCKSSSIENCQHCSSSREDTPHQTIKQKVAITQTSISEIKPETRTTATNTDMSWSSILASVVQNCDKRRATPTHKELTNRTVKPPADKRTTPQPEAKGSSSHGSSKKEASLTLVGINMETVYDPPSPEASLHLDVPEYQGQSVIEQSVVQQYGQFEGEDFPLMGESALVYSERRRTETGPRQSPLVRHEKHSEGVPVRVPEACVGATFYNNALNNVQQILGDTRGEEYQHARPSPPEEKHRRDGSGTGPKKSPSLHPLHPQQFGLSFLDPSTLVGRPRVAPAFDTFYLPVMMQGGIPHEDLEHLDGGIRRLRKPLAPNYVSDNRLVAIACQSAGSRSSPDTHLQVRRTKEILFTQREIDFSFATKQFLGKYELDN